MAAVIAYLDKVDPEAAKRARHRYACFDLYGDDPQAYGFAAGLQLGQTCENEVITQLVDLRRHAAEYAMRDGRIAEDDYFYTEQNARLVRDAEHYYRTMYLGEVSSWNLRDRHMAETLDALVEFFERNGTDAKVVVWAHNSHLGDARATQMGVRGEWNVGQLVREQYGRDAVLVGCTTYDGTVTAASNWDAPAERKSCPPGPAGELRSPVPRRRPRAIPADPPRRPSAGPGSTAAGARDRRHLPARDRASQPLFSREPARAVRRRAPFRPDAGGRAAGAHRPHGSKGEVPETFPSGI